ncbi:MAG: hypothetical protein WCK06_06195 [Actinomycetota bacterium]
MTDPITPTPRRKRSATRKPSATNALTGSLAIFLACFAFLAWQVSAGQDPALGSPVVQAQRTVIVKQIHRNVIVTDVLAADAASVPSTSSAPDVSTQVVQQAQPVAAQPVLTTQAS